MCMDAIRSVLHLTDVDEDLRQPYRLALVKSTGTMEEQEA